jgi:hypothetical protein
VQAQVEQADVIGFRRLTRLPKKWWLLAITLVSKTDAPSLTLAASNSY